MIDPSTIQEAPVLVPEYDGECAKCKRSNYHSNRHYGNQQITKWFIVANLTVCASCHSELERFGKAVVKLDYGQAAVKEGPRLIGSTFKEEFEELEKFNRELST